MKVHPFVKRGVLGLGIIAVAFAATGLAGPWWRDWRDHRSLAALSSNPETASVVSALKKAEQKRKENPNDVSAYIEAGLAWKMLGEITTTRAYFLQARNVYEAGYALFAEKNTIISLNAANMNVELGDHARAEKLYRATIAADPGFQEAHVAYIEFLRYKKKAPSEEIQRAYESALKSLVDNAVVFQGYGFYLFEIGEYRAAIPFLEVLAKKYPDESYLRFLAEARAHVP